MRRGFLWAILLFGCTKPTMQSTETIELPEQWTAATPNLFGLPEETPWWYACGDQQCIAWIERGLKCNTDIRQALGRLQELGALYVAAVGQNGPQMQMNGFAESFQQSRNAPLQQGVNILVNRWYDDITLGFVSAWEVDVWGRLEALRCSAASDFEAATSALMIQSVTIPAEIATTVNAWRAAQKRLNLLEERIGVVARRCDINNSLKQAGLLDDGVVATAQQTLAILQAQAPLLQQTIGEAVRRLAVLMGEYPDRILEEGISLKTEFVEPIFPAVIPSQILLKRPDVRQTYYQLAAAESRVALAVAQRYPIISLATTLGLDSSAPNQFLQGRSVFASFGPQILQTILDGGNLAQQAEAAAQRQAQALAAFQSAILGAFQEIENALNGSFLLKRNVEALLRAQAAASKQKALNRDLFAQGLINESDMLNSEENWIVSTDAVLGAQASLQNQWISLARATASEPTRKPLVELKSKK